MMAKYYDFMRGMRAVVRSAVRAGQRTLPPFLVHSTGLQPVTIWGIMARADFVPAAALTIGPAERLASLQHARHIHPAKTCCEPWTLVAMDPSAMESIAAGDHRYRNILGS